MSQRSSWTSPKSPLTGSRPSNLPSAESPHSSSTTRYWSDRLLIRSRMTDAHYGSNSKMSRKRSRILGPSWTGSSKALSRQLLTETPRRLGDARSWPGTFADRPLRPPLSTIFVVRWKRSRSDRRNCWRKGRLLGL